VEFYFHAFYAPTWSGADAFFLNYRISRSKPLSRQRNECNCQVGALVEVVTQRRQTVTWQREDAQLTRHSINKEEVLS